MNRVWVVHVDIGSWRKTCFLLCLSVQMLAGNRWITQTRPLKVESRNAHQGLPGWRETIQNSAVTVVSASHGLGSQRPGESDTDTEETNTGGATTAFKKRMQSAHTDLAAMEQPSLCSLAVLHPLPHWLTLTRGQRTTESTYSGLLGHRGAQRI